MSTRVLQHRIERAIRKKVPKVMTLPRANTKLCYTKDRPSLALTPSPARSQSTQSTTQTTISSHSSKNRI